MNVEKLINCVNIKKETWKTCVNMEKDPLTGIFEDENFPNEQNIAQKKLIDINRRPTKVITNVHDQTSVHWDSTIQSTVTIPRK